jgi:signal transduction histidine kinase/CheY-like chemotaxis protein
MAASLWLAPRTLVAASRVAAAALVSLGVAVLAPAQDPPQWRMLTSSEGLAESWVADVTLGPSGRVFITHGAVASMSVYDGFQVTHLPSPGPNLTVREAPDGQLWALLSAGVERDWYRGLQVFDGARWKPYPLAHLDPFAANRRDFLPWAPGKVLILTPGRLVEFDAVTASLRDVLRSEPGLGTLLACETAAKGGVWIVAAKAVVHLSPGGDVDRTFPLPTALAGAHGALVAEDPDGSLILSLGRRSPLEFPQRVVRLEHGAFTVLAEGGAREAAALAGWPGIDGQWWLATIHPATFDLALRFGTEGRTLQRHRYLSGQWSSVTPDGAGGMWISTAIGLVHHKPSAWREPPGIPSAATGVGSTLLTRRGELFLLQIDKLLRTSDGTAWRSYRLPPSTFVNVYHTRGLAELPDGRIALARDKGIQTFDPVRETFARTAPPEGDDIEVLGPAASGGVWILADPETNHGSLQVVGGAGTPSRIVGSERWRSGPPRAVVETKEGDVYVVPDGDGVGRVRAGVLDSIGRAQGYPGSGPFCGAEVSPGVLWFGDRVGVVEFDGTKWRVVRSDLQTVRTIHVARDGTVWVASGTGLHRYRDRAWLSMTAADGLPDAAVLAVVEDAGGHLWATTTGGVSRYHPDADVDAPRTRLDPAANQREVPPSGTSHLAFGGADRWAFTTPDRLLYSWRVDAGTWTPFLPETTANLANLGAGRHRFEVRAMDRTGNADATAAVFDLDVLRPWYLATGFLLLGLPALLLAGGGIGLFVTRYLRLEKLVDERTRALRDANVRVRREAEERQRAESQFHQAQKLEAVGRLAGGVAHDFNNLLMVISGYADLLLEDLPPDDPRRTPGDEIARAAGRAAALTRQLLAFGRHQVTRTEPLDLNTVVRDISRMLGRLIGEDVSLVFRPADDLWPVLADRGQVEQVLVNLTVNGRDAMPHGGRLEIALANTVVDEAFCDEHREARAGECVRLSVSDNGIGMDAETISRIFEPFFTTKDVGKGTGLGLSVVYGIVRGAGGWVLVASQAGEGTRFDVYFPRAATAPVAQAAQRREPLAGGTERLLVVEDDGAVRAFAIKALARHGYQVMDAPSAEAAMRIVERQEGIALVLTDIVMTGGSGVELAGWLRQHRPAIRIVLMSGYADRRVLDEALHVGEVDFLQKPFTPDALARKVREALDR